MSRSPGWTALVVGALVLGIPGLWIYVTTSARVVHPDAEKIPSVVASQPLTTWNGPVESARKIMRVAIAERNLPGASVAVGMGGEIVWAEGFGFADLESSRPVTPQDRFRIGTASTLLVSAALGVLVDQGRLKLHDAIQKHVPQFPQKQWPVSVGQVMGDMGGFRAEDLDDGVLTSVHCEETRDAMARFDQEPLAYQPGTARNFSSFGWVLLTAVVEGASGKPFRTFLQEAVLRPAGIQGTGTEAIAYYPRFGPNPYLGLPKYGLKPLHRFDYSCYAGANGYLATPTDLVRFGMAINGGNLLRPETVQTLQTEQRLTSGAETGYGLGWRVGPTTGGAREVRVDGDLWAGSVATLLTMPERGVVVALTSNVSFADTPSLAQGIARAFSALPR